MFVYVPAVSDRAGTLGPAARVQQDGLYQVESLARGGGQEREKQLIRSNGRLLRSV